MKRLFVIIILSIVSCAVLAQDNGRTLKPNYRKITRVVKSTASPYFLDSLQSRFSRCDTTLTVDDLRCLYYGGETGILYRAHTRLLAVSSRFGTASRQAGVAWWQYQMLTTAVWSTGDGSKRRPLHVTAYDDAKWVANDFGAPLWFKMKGKRKFSVAPLQ